MRVTRQFDVTWASSLRLVASVMRRSPYRWCSLLFHLLTGPAKAGQPCVLSACQWSMPPAPSLGRVPGGLLGLHCIVPQYETSDAGIVFFTPARSAVVIRLWWFVFCCSCLAWLQILLRCSFLLRSPLIHRTLHILYAKSEGVGCSCFHPSLPVGLFCHFQIVRRLINVLLSTCPAKIYNIKFPLLTSIIFMIELVALHSVYIWLK